MLVVRHPQAGARVPVRAVEPRVALFGGLGREATVERHLLWNRAGFSGVLSGAQGCFDHQVAVLVGVLVVLGQRHGQGVGLVHDLFPRFFEFHQDAEQASDGVVVLVDLFLVQFARQL